MIKKIGHADLPLHSGVVPAWLASRMMHLSALIIESIVLKYGKKEVLIRLSDPLWFQSFGALLGMDWHSSGITTSVMYALKRALNGEASHLGIRVCGGRGKYSKMTPAELLELSCNAGLDGKKLVKASRLCAKVDSAAVQDGFSLYQHNFVVTDEGDWAVVQQGMNTDAKMARRYHWCSASLRSFVESPHAAVVGKPRGKILNLTDSNAKSARQAILELSNENPRHVIQEIKSIISSPDDFLQHDLFASESAPERNIIMPHRHDVRCCDVDLKRLGAVLATSYEEKPSDFESLLLTKGLGARTLQSLTLASEVIYGTPSRFTDPARFSFAHGGKDGHPFPVPCRIYDETINVLGECIEKSRLNYKDKSSCLEKLYNTSRQIEKFCAPCADFDKTIERERKCSKQWGGRVAKE